MRKSLYRWDSKELLTRQQAAEYLGLKPATLRDWAWREDYKLPYIKIGKFCQYKKSDLDRFVEDRTRFR